MAALNGVGRDSTLIQPLRKLVLFERPTNGMLNPVLAGPEVPPLHLDPQANPPARLDWNSWIPALERPPPGIRHADAADALFEAEIVEAEEMSRHRGRP